MLFTEAGQVTACSSVGEVGGPEVFEATVRAIGIAAAAATRPLFLTRVGVVFFVGGMAQASAPGCSVTVARASPLGSSVVDAITCTCVSCAGKLASGGGV